MPELVGDRLPQDARFDGRAVGLQRKAHQPRIGVVVLAEGNDALDAGRLGGGGKPRILRIVAIEHGGAARLDAGKNFRLGVGDLLQRAEIFQMHRLNRR